MEERKTDDQNDGSKTTKQRTRHGGRSGVTEKGDSIHLEPLYKRILGNLQRSTEREKTGLNSLKLGSTEGLEWVKTWSTVKSQGAVQVQSRLTRPPNSDKISTVSNSKVTTKGMWEVHNSDPSSFGSDGHRIQSSGRIPKQSVRAQKPVSPSRSSVSPRTSILMT